MNIKKFAALRPFVCTSLILSSLSATAYTFSDVFQHSTETIMTDKTREQQAADISRIILKYALTKDIDAENVQVKPSAQNQTGLPELQKKILHFVKHKKPLVFTLIGFPFKSGNMEKNVISSRPDYAERLALENLQNFMREISQIYSPGAKLIIYTDGLAFHDLLGISLENVINYEDSLKQLATDLPLISIVTCRDLFPNQTPQEIQNHIKRLAGSPKPLTPEEKDILSQRLLKELDYHQGKNILKEKPLPLLAEEMHKRSQQISHLYKSKFPESIRLSVHYQKDLGQKIGVALVPGSLTPWHGVIVSSKGGSFVMKQKQEVSKQAQISSKEINGIICHFYMN
jgi:pyoverdine/dityrosine biosynthesis protein Dit1